jgi:bacterioferritin-associated ferredoxin
MIVCVCKAVSEKHIRAAVKDGARQVADLSRDLGLGTCCGKCLPQARASLADSLRQHEARASDCFPGTITEFAL